MSNNLFTFFLFFIVLSAHSAFTFAELPCMKDTRSEDDINICQHAAAKELELQLNELEKSIRNRFKSPQTERFDEAQTRWQQMAEKDCEIEADFYEGAPIYPAIHAQCLQRHYQDRLQTLKKYLCPEYSLGNGCEISDARPLPVELPTATTRTKSTSESPKVKGTKRFR